MGLQRFKYALVSLVMSGASLYGSYPFCQEPGWNFNAYTGFRRDQLTFHISDPGPFQKLYKQFHPKKNGHCGCPSVTNTQCPLSNQDPEALRKYREYGLSHYKESRHCESPDDRYIDSKVKWKGLNIAQVGATASYSTYNHYYLRGYGDYGKICSGHADIDNSFDAVYYIQRKRERLPPSYGRYGRRRRPRSRPIEYDTHVRREYSQQTANANGGFVGDASMAVGWKVFANNGRMWIAGVGGYSGHWQRLKLTNFRQKKDTYDLFEEGPIPSLKGNYSTTWQGPFVGFDTSIFVDYSITLFGSAEWHWADYNAQGNWQFLDNYSAHIRHKARGYGIVGVLGFDWRSCFDWNFGVVGNFQQWSTRYGTNYAYIGGSYEFYPQDATFPVIKKSKLQNVKWISFSISALATYRF